MAVDGRAKSTTKVQPVTVAWMEQVCRNSLPNNEDWGHHDVIVFRSAFRRPNKRQPNGVVKTKE
jgi:hypothetical protein